MSIELIISAIIILLIFIGGILIVLKNRKPTLSPALYTKTVKGIYATQSLAPAHAILESHKICIKAFQSLTNKRMGAAQVANHFLKYIPNEKEFWNYHRLRNRIAHETDIKVSPKQADIAREVFVRALNGLK